MKKILALLILIQLAHPAFAVTADPTPAELIQPDGTVFAARLAGDERESWVETLEGYSVVQDGGGWWRYAVPSESGEVLASSEAAGKCDPSFKVKHIHEDSWFNGDGGIHLGPTTREPATVTGTGNILVLLINFTDDPRVDADTYTPTYYENKLFNASNTSSMAAYFDEVSYGTYAVTGEAGGDKWYESVRSMSYYGSDSGSSCYGFSVDDANVCSYRLICEAVALADDDVNFADYDADDDGLVDYLIVVHAGCDQAQSLTTCSMSDPMWSVAWDASGGSLCGLGVTYDGKTISNGVILAEDSPMGTFSHEFGHSIGLPDLYDTSSSTWEGAGEWDIMASGNWLGSPAGSSPAHLSAWSKYYLGWVTPQQVTTPLYDEQVKAAESFDDVYQLMVPLTDSPADPSSGTKEYFLVENRQKTGFDTDLNGDGLLIWHIKDNPTRVASNLFNAYETSKGVDLEEADEATQSGEGLDAVRSGGGDRGSAGDPWSSSSAGFTDSSTPDSKARDDSATYINITDISASAAIMTADFLQSGTSTADTTAPNLSLSSPADGASVNARNVTFVYSVTDNSSIQNCSLQGNFTGSWQANTSSASVTVNSSNNFTVEVEDGSFVWNVECFDASNNSALAAANYSLTVDATAPSAPNVTSPGEYVNSSSANWSWNLADNSSIQYYSIEFANNSAYTGALTLNTSDANYTSSSLADAVTYFLRVRAVDDNNNTGGWGSANTTVDLTAPTAPDASGLNSTYSEDTPTLNWTNSSDNTSGVSYYLYEGSVYADFSVVNGSLGFTGNTTNNSFTPNSSLNDDLYYFRVRGVDAAGNAGAFSTTVNFTVKTVYINEVYPFTTEWIELYNAESTAKSLVNWTLAAAAGNASLTQTAGARGFLVLNYSNTNLALNEAGDTVYLYNARGLLADNVTFSSAQTNYSTNYSFGRSSDGAGVLEYFNESAITQGATNSGSTTQSILLAAGWNLVSIPVSL